jgi:hypothetical protein
MRLILNTKLLKNKKGNDVIHGAKVFFFREANSCLSGVQVLSILWYPNVMDGIPRTSHLFLLEYKLTQLILFRLIYLRPVLMLRILPLSLGRENGSFLSGFLE